MRPLSPIVLLLWRTLFQRRCNARARGVRCAGIRNHDGPVHRGWDGWAQSFEWPNRRKP